MASPTSTIVNMAPCQVYVSTIQLECEPAIPLYLHLVFPDGSSETVDNNLNTDDLLGKYGDKLSPRAYELFVEELGFRLFDSPAPYKNTRPFVNIEGFF